MYLLFIALFRVKITLFSNYLLHKLNKCYEILWKLLKMAISLIPYSNHIAILTLQVVITTWQLINLHYINL